MLRIIFLGLIILPCLGLQISKAEPSLDEDLALILKIKSGPVSDSTQDNRLPPANPSELSLLGNGIIKIYQTVISSQDVEACNFQPSCSHFAAEAIHRGGFLKGLLLTADRLSRCHLFAQPQIDEDGVKLRSRMTRKIYDPPEFYLAR